MAQPRTWRFEAGPVDLRELARRVSAITGQVVVYGPEFTGEVELAPEDQEMTREQVWEFFLAVLASRGWSVVVSGGVARVVPREEMISQDQPVVAPGEPPPPPSEQIVTVTIQLQYARADLVARQLLPLVGPDGRVIAVPGQNRLLLVDTAANIERLRAMARRLDNPGESEAIQVVRLEHADPAAVGAILRELLADFSFAGGRVQRRGGAAGVVVVSDPHTHSVVLRGAQREINGAALLASRLDGLEQPDAFIVRLQNCTADEQEQLLRQLLR